MNIHVALPLLVPLFMAGMLLFLGPALKSRVLALNVLGSLALFLSSIYLWKSVWEKGTQVLEVGKWPAPFGIALVVDLFSASMVAITGLMGFAVAIYLQGEEKLRQSTPLHYFVAYQTLLMGVCGAFLTGDLFNLYVWFEVMLMSSFVLMAFEGSRAQLEGAFKYTVLNLMASVLFLVAVGLLYAALGTLNMAHLSQLVTEQGSSFTVKAAFMLLLVAFGMKAGVFPLFFWLPASYHTPRIATAALLAGLLTKVGVYSVIRITTLIFSDTLEFTRPLLTAIACMTMLTGVLGAAYHYDIRRILSFHIISQIGYMILGLAFWTQAAIAASVFYILHHIVVKTNLFLVGGVINEMKGTTELKKMGGLFSKVPWFGFCFLIPALSLAGMPPLSGFFAKFSLLSAGLAEREFLAVGIALIVGLLTLFSMMKIWLEAFWKPHPGPESSSSVQKIPLQMFLPVALLAFVTISIGLWPQMLFDSADRIAAELLNPSDYVDTVLKRGGAE